MKRYIFAFLLFSAVFATCKTTIAQVTDNKILSEEEYLDSMKYYKNEIIEIRKEIKSSQELLNQSINLQEKFINNFGFVTDTHGNIIMSFTWVLGLLTIALPIFTYLFGIQPARKEITKLQENIDGKIKSFIESSREQQINKAIEGLKSDNDEISANSLQMIRLYAPYGFKDEQYKRLFEDLEAGKIDDHTEKFLVLSLVINKNKYADQYFKRALTTDKENIWPSIRYFQNFGLKNYIDAITLYIQNSDDSVNRYVDILELIKESNEDVSLLLNDEGIVNSYSEEELEELEGMITPLREEWLMDDQLEGSYLSERLNKLH